MKTKQLIPLAFLAIVLTGCTMKEPKPPHPAVKVSATVSQGYYSPIVLDASGSVTYEVKLTVTNVSGKPLSFTSIRTSFVNEEGESLNCKSVRLEDEGRFVDRRGTEYYTGDRQEEKKEGGRIRFNLGVGEGEEIKLTTDGHTSELLPGEKGSKLMMLVSVMEGETVACGPFDAALPDISNLPREGSGEGEKGVVIELKEVDVKTSDAG